MYYQACDIEVTFQTRMWMSIDICFFVYENVTLHFGFEVERQMTFVKHVHIPDVHTRLKRQFQTGVW